MVDIELLEDETSKQHGTTSDHFLHIQMEPIDHFLRIHPHPLNFFEDRPEHGGSCKGCCIWFDESSSCYGCSDCRFYLHKSCAELPREILNFFHPCTLILDIPHTSISSFYTCNACLGAGSGFSYHCEGCLFDMHVKCAQRLTIQSQGGEVEELIQHFTHWHPLKLLVDPSSSNHLCKICDNNLCFTSGSSAYGCQKGCNFFVHKSCIISIPRQINNHSFHPSCSLILLTDITYRCKGCDEAASGLTFRCGNCKFQLDVNCALTVDTIRHFSHKHPLALRQAKEIGGKVQCGACGEYCLLDSCYVCIKKSCDFFLHKKCADELQVEIHHPFHSLHPLTLLHDSSYRCKICDEDGSGLAYCCKKCKFHLDLKCASFPTIHQSKDADEILHCGHNHPLVALHESNEFGNEVRCRACAKSCLAPCFGCTECNFFLHKTCAAEVQEKDIRHPFHPLHSLTLSSTPPLHDRGTFQCDACLASDDWFILRYRCAECDFDLHRDCVKHKHTMPDIKYEGHRHHLTYFDKTFAPVECSICQKNAQTCFFRCLACKFNVHIYCIPSTPKTIEQQCHLHPLTVTESPFEYELISSEYADGLDDHEFYCDVCEEKRYKFESVYYCADCKFIAEVRCVLFELLPPLIQSTLEATTVTRDENSEATIEELGKKIATSEFNILRLTRDVERYRELLKNYVRNLEKEKQELVNLTNDKFLYEYYYLS